MRSGRIVPLSDLVPDGFSPGLLVYRKYYNPPRPVPRTTREEDFSNPSPPRYIFSVTAKLPAWDAEAHVHRCAPRCTSSVGPGTITITENTSSDVETLIDGTGFSDLIDGTGSVDLI